jgi:hypothetical protein
MARPALTFDERDRQSGVTTVLDFPTEPDIGSVKFTQDDTMPGGVLINVAGVLRLANDAGNERGRTLYREFCRVWACREVSVMSRSDREMAALRAAMSAMAQNHGPTPSLNERQGRPCWHSLAGEPVALRFCVCTAGRARHKSPSLARSARGVAAGRHGMSWRGLVHRESAEVLAGVDHLEAERCLARFLDGYRRDLEARCWARTRRGVGARGRDAPGSPRWRQCRVRRRVARPFDAAGRRRGVRGRGQKSGEAWRAATAGDLTRRVFSHRRKKSTEIKGEPMRGGARPGTGRPKGSRNKPKPPHPPLPVAERVEV